METGEKGKILKSSWRLIYTKTNSFLNGFRFIYVLFRILKSFADVQNYFYLIRNDLHKLSIK